MVNNGWSWISGNTPGIITNTDLPALVLNITNANGQTQISWPAAWAGCQLTSVPALGTQADWQPVTNPVTLIGDQNTVSLTPDSPAAFFRLVAPPSTNFVTLANGVIAANLSRTLTTDWTLSINVCQNAPSGWQTVSLFDAAGSQGYGFGWDSSTGGNGLVSIIKYGVTPPLQWNSPCTTLTIPVDSGHGITNPPFALFQLSWSAESSILTLSVDGVQKGSVVDTSCASFSRLFIGGNTSVWFANVSVTTPGGAALPFTTYEAEAALCSTGVTVTAMNAANLVSIGSLDLPVTEASGRAYATLSAQGQSLTFQVTGAANSIVVRHNVPFVSPYNTLAGPGATLHLWVNNESTNRQVTQVVYTSTTRAASQVFNALSLSSYHNESNTAYWEETRALISGPPLNPGDSLRLEVDSGDNGTPYNIDCIDLENVPAPLSQPTNTYSVTSYGAYGNGIHDDTTFIQNCINAAQRDGKDVWIPPGIYMVDRQFTLPGVKVFGAGMWYTHLIGIVVNPYCPGFSLNGTGSEVHDLYIDSIVGTSRSNGSGEFTGSSPNLWVIQNVWLTHTGVFSWMVDAMNGLVSGCRVRFTYADGIHLDANCATNTIINCHVRGAGDDGIAVLSNTNRSTPSHDNTVIYNTVVANWWAANCDLAGGYNNVISYNYFTDSGGDGSFVLNMPGAYPMHATTGATIAGNTIVRGGGDGYNQHRGAIWIYPSYGYPTNSCPLSGVTFNGNYLENSLWRGVHLAYFYRTNSTSITFNNTTINGLMNSTGDGFAVDYGYVGTGTFNNNTVKVPGSPYHNSAPTTFTGSGSNNVPPFSFP
jgi:hypothetical protein